MKTQTLAVSAIISGLLLVPGVAAHAATPATAQPSCPVLSAKQIKKAVHKKILVQNQTATCASPGEGVAYGNGTDTPSYNYVEKPFLIKGGSGFVSSVGYMYNYGTLNWKTDLITMGDVVYSKHNIVIRKFIDSYSGVAKTKHGRVAHVSSVPSLKMAMALLKAEKRKAAK